ncbi:hypothetical protein LWX53_08610 [bacterium]|nr:hypothetical protein [bacterium]
MKAGLRDRLFARRESTVSSSAEMAVFTILNTALNFLRSVIVAARYGAGALSDAYYATVSLLYTPAGLLSDSLTALVPPRSQAHRAQGREPDFLASYLSVTAAAFLILAGLFALFGRTIAGAVLGGLDRETIGTVQFLLLLSLPAIVLAPLCVILDNVLKSDRYFIFGNSGSLLNSVLSTSLLFFIAKMGVAGIVVSTLAGLAANFAILLVAVFRKKILPGRIDFLFGLREAKKALPLFVGGLLGIAAGYVEKGLASYLPAGSITLLSMSSSLLGVARSLLVGTFISVYYPFISEAVMARDKAKFAELMAEAKRIVFGVFGLGVICMIVFAKPLFGLLFGHGRFNAGDVASLAAIFGAGSFGVVQAGLANLVNFSYYSKGDTKTPVAVSIVAGTAGAILLQFAVVRLFGAIGLSAATAVAGMATLLLGAALLSKRHGLDILDARDISLAFVILALGVASGFIAWTPWEMGLPAVYYYFISLKKYGLSPRKLADMIRRAFGRSGGGGKERAR